MSLPLSLLFFSLKSHPSTQTDPIVRYGKHFGRTISAVTDILILITNGLDRLADVEEQSTVIEDLPAE